MITMASDHYSFYPMYQDNLFVWDLELSDFEKGSALQSDLENYARIYNQKVRDPVLDDWATV